MTKDFDPGAAAQPGSGIFGLPHDETASRVVVVPVPFDATTSYRRGTAGGPAAVLEASRQVDLFDREVGRPYEAGIFMREIPADVLAWNEEAQRAADPIIERGGDIEGDAALAKALARVNELSERVNAHVHAAASALLAQGKLPVVLGGDHATPFGAIRAQAEHAPGVGVLHVDAHADLRPAYEGFTWSHASIMHNVVTRLPDVAKLVQVGIRDFSEEELSIIEGSRGRVETFFDADLARARLEGEPFAKQVERIVSVLPERVYVSFDIDGLDPTLCPSTGTPVPGGLSFHEASYLVGAVARSGRRIVGLDLNEVAPSPEGDEWDANVGARVLYRLIGWALRSVGR
jgi:agmatinase